MLQFYLSIIFCHMLSCVFDNLLTINVWWWWWCPPARCRQDR